MRKLTNCTVEFVGGTVPGIVSDQPAEAVMADVRVQARDIAVRVLASDISGLGHCVEEGVKVCVKTTLPLAQGDYKLAIDPTPLPNTGHVLLALRKTFR